MRLNEINYNDAKPIEGYGLGFFRVGGEVYEGAVICSAHGVQTWGGYEDAQPLMDLASEVDVVFVGTGSEIAHIPSSLRQTLEEVGLGVEVMNTPSACRTYNILLSEGRRIAAALVPVSEIR